jgi:virginiamycin B lyase
MTSIRWTLLLGVSAVVATVVVNLPRMAKAQEPEPVQGIYWKADDLKTALNLPRTSSDIQPAGRAKEESLPDPYYEVDSGLRPPAGMSGVGFSHVAFDSHGNIWTLNGGGAGAPISEFTSKGKYVKSIGEGQEWFVGAHFLYIDRDDNLWVGDNQARPGRGNMVTKISPDGNVLLRLGKPGVKGGSPETFMGPVGVVTNANGDIFVTDGHFVDPDGGGRAMAGEYFNWGQGTREVTHARIAKFSKDGKFIKQWGRQGSGPGEFYVPHGIAMDSQGRIFVADRGNNRIQIFDQEGKLIDIWKQFGKPCDVAIDANDVIYVTDSDSNRNLWTQKYSTVRDPREVYRVPRLTDVGSPNPDYSQGIRIGSAKDGRVTGYIPPHMGEQGPTTIPERSTADAKGNIWSSDARTQLLRKYVKKPDLPEAAGKQLVQKACESCHDLRAFPRVNYDQQDWQMVVNTMVAGGAPLTKQEIPVVVDYLAKTFKGNSAKGVEIPGPVQAAVTEWDLPVPNALPYDIISTRNGVYFTATFGNLIGRFDPKTQQFEKYPLRPGTRPSTLFESAGANYLGTIWFTSQTGGLIGEFHPMVGYTGYWGKGDVFEHPISGPKLPLGDIAFGPGGIWFTVPATNNPTAYPAGSKIGRVHQYSLEPKMADLPNVIADPAGLAFNSKGVLFFAERGTARLGSINPLTMQVTEYVMPEPESGATSVTVTPDNAVWYTDNLRGYLGRFDPQTGKFSEWSSPSGARSRPDGILRVGNALWYAESGATPNMLVRFDLKTEKFQTWPVKDGGGIKHLQADRDGSLWLTRPMTNGIAHVVIKDE